MYSVRNGYSLTQHVLFSRFAFSAVCERGSSQHLLIITWCVSTYCLRSAKMVHILRGCSSDDRVQRCETVCLPSIQLTTRRFINCGLGALCTTLSQSVLKAWEFIARIRHNFSTFASFFALQTCGRGGGGFFCMPPTLLLHLALLLPFHSTLCTAHKLESTCYYGLSGWHAQCDTLSSATSL